MRRVDAIGRHGEVWGKLGGVASVGKFRPKLRLASQLFFLIRRLSKNLEEQLNSNECLGTDCDWFGLRMRENVSCGYSREQQRRY